MANRHQSCVGTSSLPKHQARARHWRALLDQFEAIVADMVSCTDGIAQAAEARSNSVTVQRGSPAIVIVITVATAVRKSVLHCPPKK